MFKISGDPVDGNHMGVIQGFASPWDGKRHATVDVAAASLFLRAQASWLCRGLTRNDDPAAVGIVLGAHDASHESWLTLIAATQVSHGDDTAQEIAALYGFHGRVVGSLERGLDRRLETRVADHIRELLAERLRDLTQAAIARLGSGEAHTDRPAEAVSG
jgi:hypothetical protein